VGLGIHTHGFDARVSLGDTVELQLIGSSNQALLAPLRELVTQVHDAVCAAPRTRVVIDLTSLEFMTAACFNVFVAWIDLINELPPDKRYQLQFRSNPTIPWQRRSLHTLSCFATGLVVVDAGKGR
jgi:hypothetical protein